MKKTIALVFALALAASAASAETVKGQMEKANGFWDREAERSGMKDSTSSWGKFWANMNPGKFFQEQKEAYDARKTGAAQK